ncbi:hypothetical protein C0995_010175 [Termitomyces sp. Mi166|nr:hypothetical protein C0995_010175 [Termitomyces sp. Mi166\
MASPAVDGAEHGDEHDVKHDDKPQTPWQAIYSPQHNAYYFFNTETHETTWDNPLASPPHTDPHAALEAAAIAAGIDPSLAHLDPSLLPGPSTSSLSPSFTAKFNARTGQFTRPDARDPSHLSEHARAARMSEFYFDVNAWENQLAEQGGSIMGSEEKKRKRPSKKDLERFKEQKKQKKLAKTAWLRT